MQFEFVFSSPSWLITNFFVSLLELVNFNYWMNRLLIWCHFFSIYPYKVLLWLVNYKANETLIMFPYSRGLLIQKCPIEPSLPKDYLKRLNILFFLFDTPLVFVISFYRILVTIQKNYHWSINWAVIWIKAIVINIFDINYL